MIEKKNISKILIFFGIVLLFIFTAFSTNEATCSQKVSVTVQESNGISTEEYNSNVEVFPFSAQIKIGGVNPISNVNTELWVRTDGNSVSDIPISLKYSIPGKETNLEITDQYTKLNEIEKIKQGTTSNGILYLVVPPGAELNTYIVYFTSIKADDKTI